MIDDLNTPTSKHEERLIALKTSVKWWTMGLGLVAVIAFGLVAINVFEHLLQGGPDGQVQINEKKLESLMAFLGAEIQDLQDGMGQAFGLRSDDGVVVTGVVDDSPADKGGLQAGDVIVVKPGERIPMDGRVIAGASSVNQAPITGESRLVEKVVGSEVFASSINGEGSLEIEVTHVAADNTISRLVKMVEEAQEKRASSQRFVDRFARVYTPAVVALAVLAATIPPLFFGQPFLNPDPDTFGWL